MLPARPSIEWLRKTAKQLLTELRAAGQDVRLADAQLEVARRHGFASWRKLVAFVDAVDASGDELRAAVRANDVAKVSAILDDDPDLVDAAEDLLDRDRPSDEPRMSLLHLAVAEGHLAMVELLVARGANVDARNAGGRTALHDCFELNRDAIARVLMEHATIDVCAAAAYGLHEQLVAILRDRARADDRTTGLSPLGWAGYAHDAKAAEILVAHGATVDAAAWAPACDVGAIGVLGVLCAHGDPNVADANGNTPLHVVIASRLLQDPTAAVRVLLAAGADPHRKNRAGLSPLDDALARVGEAATTHFPKRALGPRRLEAAIELLRARPV